MNSRSKYLLLIICVFALTNQAGAQKLWKNQRDGNTNIYELGENAAAKIGIGTTNPTAKLHIYANPNTQPVFKIDAVPLGIIGSIEAWSLKNGIYYGIYQSQTGSTIPKNYFQNNVGIGVVDPLNKLDINGVLGFTGTAATGIRIDNSDQPFVFQYVYTPSRDDSLGGGNKSNTSISSPLTIKKWGAIVEGYLQCTDVLTTSKLQITDTPNTGSVFMCNDQDGNGSWTDPSVFSITEGRVGIGTPTPVAKLQVNDSYQKVGIGSAAGDSMRYGTGYIGFNSARNGTQWLVSSDGAHNGGSVIWSGIDGTLYFSNVGPNSDSVHSQYLSDSDVVNNVKMRICANGDIGIGDRNVSGYKLAVDGNVICEELKIKLSESWPWPDYVFNKDYRLRPLKEVDEFIQTNNHLPDLPSATEVAENGINVGEMNARLLKKVEELTLYVIAMEKEINQLKAKTATH